MARLPEYNRPEVVKTALHVFWREGYESASIQKLLDATALNRGSLYAAFGDKEGLFLEVLDAYTEYQSALIRPKLVAKGDPIDAIRSFLEDFCFHQEVQIRERGCLLFNTISELGQTRPHLAQEAGRKVEFLRKLLVRRLRQAKTDKVVRDDKSVDQMTDYLITLASGLRMHCKMKTESGVVGEIIEIGLEALTSPGTDNVCDKYSYKPLSTLASD